MHKKNSKIEGAPKMLMKTKGQETDKMQHAKMLMKINDLTKYHH
jgi:hypothetical protein